MPRGITILVLVIAASLAATAQAAPEWRIAGFHTTLDVTEDGSAIVMERIDLLFTGSVSSQEFHGLRRLVPIELRGPMGTRSTLFVKVIRVADGASNSLDYTVRTWRGQLEVSVPITGQAGATKTVEINYFVRNAVRYLRDHDEVYWDLTGSSLPMPVEKASARIMLPERAAEGLRVQAFTTGLDGGPLMPMVGGSTIELQTWKPLGARTAFIVDVVVPKGIFREPSWTTRAAWFVESNPILLMPLGALLVMLGLRRAKGRTPKVAVAPEYGPPEELTPAEAGTLVSDRVEPRDITATLFDLAVRGYIRIEEDHDPATGHWDYVLRLLKQRDEWRGLAPYEVAMLFNIFYGGQWTKLSSLRLRFAVALPAMRAGILNALQDKGMYRVDPEAAQAFRVAGVVLVAGLFVLAQKLGFIAFFQSALLAAVSVGASAVVVYLLGRNMSAKSLRGMRACAQVEGFREFLERVDGDRLQRIPAPTRDRFLPYAMALGVEHCWAEAFAGIAREAPEWYGLAGEQGFDAALFTRSLGSMADLAQAIFGSQPRAGIGLADRGRRPAPGS